MTFINSKPFLCFPRAPKILQLASVVDFCAEAGKAQRAVMSDLALHCCTEILLQGYVLRKNIILQGVSHSKLLFRGAASERILESKYSDVFVLVKMP